MVQHKVVVITGASAGVGRATVREFARRGHSIALIARGQDGLAAAKAEVEAAGGRAVTFAVDVADAAAVESAADEIERQLGPIDIWINNAMASVFSRVADMEPSDYRRVTEVTYLGAVHGTLAALRRMRPRNRGIILQVGSALGYRSIPLQSAYCAAKHAMVGFNDSLRCELIAENSAIKVTMVDLPALNTPQFGWVKSRLKHKSQPVPPIFQPEVAAQAIYHGTLHHRRQWFVGLPTMIAIMGNAIAPGFADWYLGRTGISGQQIDELEDPTRPNNLYEPLAGDRGARGAFDTRAKSFSVQLWLNQNRSKIVFGVIAAGLASAFVKARRPLVKAN